MEPRAAPDRDGDAPRATVFAVLGAYIACVLLLFLYLEHRPRAQPVVEPAPVTTRPAFPAPPAGAIVFSREAGQNALALALSPRRGAVVAQASMVGPDGAGISGVPTTFAVQGVKATGSACGAGCYRARLPVRGRPRSVELAAEGEVATSWRVALPRAWPPPNATKLIAGARRTWRGLRSLTFRERLASDEEHVVTSTWRVQAPDRLAYDVDRGYSAVIIGKHRWDKAPRGAWKRSPQLPITQPTPPWVATTNAHVLGTTTARGRPAWEVSFFDPKTPAWFAVVLDRETLRTLDLRMVTTAHFMHEVYGSFDAAPAIRAPRRDR
jgi:hypothetical protein